MDVGPRRRPIFRRSIFRSSFKNEDGEPSRSATDLAPLIDRPAVPWGQRQWKTWGRIAVIELTGSNVLGSIHARYWRRICHPRSCGRPQLWVLEFCGGNDKKNSIHLAAALLPSKRSENPSGCTPEPSVTHECRQGRCNRTPN